MEDRSKQNNRQYPTGPQEGPQGIDKAPGEETPANNDNFVAETQKGKNKVDGDLSRESDQPIEKQDISGSSQQ